MDSNVDSNVYSNADLVMAGPSSEPAAIPTAVPTDQPTCKRGLSPSVSGQSVTRKARKKPPRKAIKPKRPSDWHVKRKEIVENGEKTKTVLEVHIHTLWPLPGQSTSPPNVTSAERLRFSTWFSSEAAVKTNVHASLDSNAVPINDACSRVHKFLASLPQECSITAGIIQQISKAHLLVMFRSMAYFGLAHWAPDVISCDPDSMYNLLHEYIVLITFEQVASAFGYSHVGINLQLVQDFVFLRKIYRSFVFSYMCNIAKSEAKAPGSTAKGTVKTNIWKCRQELAKGQADLLRAQAFNLQVVSLAEENEAHSDDEFVEEDNETHLQLYHIKEKDGRSEKVKTFFRMLDMQQRCIAKVKQKHHRAAWQCEEPDPPQESELTTLPEKVPIDWFDPEYWNEVLTVHQRLKYVKDGIHIALPKKELCGTWALCLAWKNLSEEEFIEQHGDAVLAAYHIPTTEEVQQIDEIKKREGKKRAINIDDDSEEEENFVADDLTA